MSLCNIYLVRKNPSGLAPAPGGSRFSFCGLLLLSFLLLDFNLLAQDVDVISVEVASMNCDFDLQAQLVHPRCFGSADGRIALLGSAADGSSLSFRWLNTSNTNTGNEVDNLASGTYQVEVSDPNCSDTLSLQLVDPPELEAPYLYKAFCGETANVNLLENVSGGTGTLTYTATAISGTEVSCVTCPSSVQLFDQNSIVLVEIQDENGCTASRFVVVEFVPDIELELQVQDETCVANGEIEVTASGGSGNYLYSLNPNSNFQNTNTFTGLTGGTTYEVNVQDLIASGCLATSSASLNAIPAFSEPEIAVTDASCFGANDGVINVNLQQDEVLQVTLDTIDPASPTVNATTFEEVAPGIHTVYVQQGEVCTKSYEIMVEQPEMLLLTADSISDTSCPGENDGEIFLTIGGGTPEYDLALDGTPVDLSTDLLVLSGLSAGIHVVTLMDDNGCEETKSFTIEGEEEPDLGARTFPSCPDENTGSIVIVEAGKLLIGSYSFSLDSVNWQSENLFEELAPGEYIVYVQYPDGCVFEVPFAIDEVIPPEVELTVSHVSCPEGDDGSAAVQIANGNAATTYEYALDSLNFSTINVFEDLTAGDYTLYLRDDNACVFTFLFTIDAPTDALLDLDTQQISCAGGNDGQIEINVLAGGTTPFEYALNNGNFQPSNTFEQLVAGLYVAMVRDSNGCLYLDDVALADPAPISANIQVDHSTCGANNGLAVCNPSGGAPPYAYLWNTGDSTPFISGLAAGSYQVSISDAHHCAGTEEVLVENIAGPLLLASLDDVGCNGMTSGKIDLTVLEGTAPFQYTWSNGAHSQDLEDLSAGSYIVTVIDYNQCTDTKSYTIHEPPPIEISSQIGPSGDYWFINLTVEGGVPPYAYAWSNGETSQDIFDLSPGLYSVTVTDEEGCEDRLEVEVGITATAEPAWASSLVLYPVPTFDQLHLEVDLPLDQTLFLSLYDTGGRLVLTRQLLDRPLSTISLADLPDGLYFMKIESAEGFLFRKVVKQER